MTYRRSLLSNPQLVFCGPAETSTVANVSAALRSRPIRWIGALYALGLLVEWALGIALMVFAYEATDSPLIAAAMLICAQVAPNALVAVFAGFLDRVAIKPLYLAGTVVQAIGIAALAAGSYGPTFFVLAAVAGLGAAVTRAQVRGGLGRAAGSDHEALRAGNALLGLIRGPVGVTAPAGAGALVALLGVDATLEVLAGTLAVTALVGALKMPMLAPDGVDDAAEEPASLRHGDGPPVPVGALLALTFMVVCLFSVDEPVLLGYVNEHLGAGVSGYSAIFTAWGVGMLIGGAIFTRLLKRPMLAVYAGGTILNAAAHGGLFMSPSISVALGCAVVAGIGNGLDWSALSTAVQEAAPRGQEARIGGRLETLAAAGAGIGILCGGLLADVIGARATLLVPVIGGSALLLIGCAYLELRHLKLRRDFTPLCPSIPGGAS